MSKKNKKHFVQIFETFSKKFCKIFKRTYETLQEKMRKIVTNAPP